MASNKKKTFYYHFGKSNLKCLLTAKEKQQNNLKTEQDQLIYFYQYVISGMLSVHRDLVL